MQRYTKTRRILRNRCHDNSPKSWQMTRISCPPAKPHDFAVQSSPLPNTTNHKPQILINNQSSSRPPRLSCNRRLRSTPSASRLTLLTKRALSDLFLSSSSRCFASFAARSASRVCRSDSSSEAFDCIAANLAARSASSSRFASSGGDR